MAGRKLGIVIGTNEYSDSNIRNLRFAEKDAKDIKNILLDPDICGFDEVLESINKTRTQTFCEIDQLLKKAVSEDLILIYFSGHGEPDPQHDLCLLFNNTKMYSLIPTSLNYSLVRKCIDASSCKTVVVVLDCCYSGAASIKGNNLKEILSKSSGSGTVILSASSEFDVAKEDEKLENGVFTYYLVEGLKSGAIAGDNNGDIALDDLYNYVYERTIRYSQVPFKQVACEGKIFIGKNPLKIKEKEYTYKKKRLFEEYIKCNLPHPILNISQTILRNYYEGQSPLEPVDETIYGLLNSFLEKELFPENYIEAIQLLKKINVNEKKHELKVAENRTNQGMEELRRQREDEVEVDDKSNSNKRSKITAVTSTPLFAVTSTLLFSDFVADKKSGVEPLIVYFTDKSIGATSWQWDFGDHSPIVTTRNAEHTFGVGIWNVNLKISDGANFASKAMKITVTGKTVTIVADFIANKTSGQTPFNVQFTDASSGGAAAWSWDFGDGNKSIERNPQHTFITPGGYDVVQTVSDGKGNSATKHMRINVTAASLIADFDANKESGLAPLSVKFTDKSTGAVSWQWNFSDNSTIVTTKNAEHIFRAGTWTVILTVSDGINFASKTMTISTTSKTLTSPFTGMEFVLIPAGKFMMGSPSGEQSKSNDEGPAHEVVIKNPFYLGKYPVTQKQWENIMGNNPSSFKGEDRPVELVSWNDIKEFIKKLNERDSVNKYRLPSESEWEYACRAGTTTRYSFGGNESKLKDYAWYYENSGSETHPVGLKKPNAWGLHDIHGNVWEWCQDTWHENYKEAPSDGKAWEDKSSSTRVIRGGCWNNSAGSCRAAYRFKFDPVGRIYDLGFRLLREL
jgi:formylglycine-generating enzyme required for sulfatase activity